MRKDKQMEFDFRTAEEMARKQFPEMGLCLDIRNCLRSMIACTTFLDEYEGSGCSPWSADFRFYTPDGEWVKITVEEQSTLQ